MNIPKLLISAVLPMMSLTVAAQVCVNTPQKKDFTIAATVGYNSFTNVSAPQGNLSDYEASALTSVWMDKKLMVGFEGGFFFADKWKLNLGGGLNFTHNPGYLDVPGTAESGMSPEDMMGEIPNYRAVASQYSCAYQAYTGVDRYFGVKGVKNLMCYAGIRAGFSYALNEQKYDEWTSMGTSVGEAWNLRGSLIFGIDYFVLPAMYVGLSIDPFQYTYNLTSYRPQEGLKPLRADSHNFSILSAPTLKVGFKFGKSSRNACCQETDVNMANNKTNALREIVEVEKIVRDTVEIIKEVPALAPETITRTVFYSINEVEVPAAQEPNVATIATYLKNNPGSKATVVGYADKDTGTVAINLRLAKQRADNVAQMLQNLGVDPSRLEVSSMLNEKTEQPFSQNDLNRVVIMTAYAK